MLAKKSLISILFKIVDVLLVPFTLLTAIWMKVLTRYSLRETVVARKIFLAFDVLPVNNQYYQPLINPAKYLQKPLSADRNLRGIDLNPEGQLELLSKFVYQEELRQFSLEKGGSTEGEYYYNNGYFEPGDAEFLYSIIRYLKPRQLVEIGSGFSTLIAKEAFEINTNEDPDYQFEHICIEPFEHRWLEATGAKIIRQKVEDTDISIFQSLEAGDILFIDSSHIIRPQGDVLFEYLEILPVIKSGVYVHIHDIFTPKDYLEEWLVKRHLLWNEQYLLEAFLSQNPNFEIVGALNYLKHHHWDKLKEYFPALGSQRETEPKSFWIRRK